MDLLATNLNAPNDLSSARMVAETVLASTVTGMILPPSPSELLHVKNTSPDMTRSRLGARIIIQYLRVSGFHRSMLLIHIAVTRRNPVADAMM